MVIGINEENKVEKNMYSMLPSIWGSGQQIYIYEYLYIYIFAYIFKNGRFNKKLIKKTLKGDRGTKKKSRNWK